MPRFLGRFVLLCLALPALTSAQPRPNHPLGMGYYFADGIAYGDYTSEVFPYVDLYIANPCAFNFSENPCPNAAAYQAAVSNAVANGKKIVLGMPDDTALWGYVLDLTAPYWSSVRMIGVHHEATHPLGAGQEPSANHLDGDVAAIKNLLNNRGLPYRAFGVTMTRTQAMSSDGIYARDIDWVAIEAYSQTATGPENLVTYRQYIKDAKARAARAGKWVVLVGQAYDRNGNFTDINNLTQMQDVCYEEAAADPNVRAIFQFSYARPGGTKFYPTLKARHQVHSGRIYADDDGDGIRDSYEIQFGLNPNANDAAGDPDADGLTNLQEYQAGSHPRGFYKQHFAEGSKNALFQTEYSVTNYGAFNASVVLTARTPGGGAYREHMSVDAKRSITLTSSVFTGLPNDDFGLTAESDMPIVVGRVMRWDSLSNYGSHGERATSQARTSWFMAEGGTADFNLYYLLLNPNAVAAQVTVTYLRPGGAPPIVIGYTVQPQSRMTIDVKYQHPDLAANDISAAITSTQPILAERAMYLTAPGIAFAAGHNSVAAPATATTWHFAEGSTGNFFDTYFLLANPNGTAAAVTATYFLESGGSQVRNYTVPANGRLTVYANGAGLGSTAFSARFDSATPVVVERSMWWPQTFPNHWTEAHNTVGTTQTGAWYAVPSGDVGRPGGLDQARTYVLISNPTGAATTVRVTLLRPGSVAQGGSDPVYIDYLVAASSRKTVDMAMDFSPYLGQGGRFGVTVESLNGAQIVVEQATYSNRTGSSGTGMFWEAGYALTGLRVQ